MKNILFLDIDNTLLVPQNIFIYYNNGNISEKYTPEEYTHLHIKYEDKQYYDYSDFQDPDIIKNSIISSTPIMKTLELIKIFLDANFCLGIITARGQENVIAETIIKWLKINIKKYFILKRENIHGINDHLKKYKGINDQEKKLNVLKTYINKYDNIFFMDDNLKTINLIKKFNTKINIKDRKSTR